MNSSQLQNLFATCRRALGNPAIYATVMLAGLLVAVLAAYALNNFLRERRRKRRRERYQKAMRRTRRTPPSAGNSSASPR